MMTVLNTQSDIKPRTGLRRADWRFLLPIQDGTIRHLVLLGAPEGLGERMLEAGVAQQISYQLPKQRSADVVAVLHHRTNVSIEEISACLVPGGALYYEVNRRYRAQMTLTPRRLLHQLTKADLVPAGVYWAAPNFEHRRRFIPLDVPEAFEWYLSTLFLAGTPLYRLVEIGLQLFKNVGKSNFASIAPCFSMTAVTKGAEQLLPSVLGHPTFPKELRRDGMRPAVLTSRQDDGSRVVILPFVPGSKEPSAVVKIATLADFNRNTSREQEILTEVRSHLDESVRRSVPEPLGVFTYGGLAVSIESYASGHPILVSSGRWRASFEERVFDLRLAANWLTRFHCQAQFGRLTWDKSAIERWIKSPLNAYIRTFGLTPEEEMLFDRVRRCSRELVGSSLPLVRMHYDFSPWNIYRYDRELTVIDWEFGRNWECDRFGPPLYDLLYFVTYWFHYVKHINDEAAELDCLYSLFVEPDCQDRYIQAAHQVITEYLTELDIDRRFLPIMLVYVWIEQALHRFERKQNLGIIKKDARTGNRAVEYIRILAQHVDRLFRTGIALPDHQG